MVLLAGSLFVGCPGGSSDDDGGDAGVEAGDPGDHGGDDADGGAGEGVGPDCSFENIPHDPWAGEVIQLVLSEVATCVKMVREADGMVGGFTWNYKLMALTIGHQEDVVTISDPGSLDYQVTHHNWYDVATGVRAGVVYRLETEIDDADLTKWHYYLTESDEQTQQVLRGPFELFPAGL